MSDRATLKTYFETADIPTAVQFADLIDSLAVQTDMVNVQSTAGLAWSNVSGALGGYSTLGNRLDSLIMSSGGNTATLTSGGTGAGQPVINVDSASGFIAGARVAYPLATGVIEYNTIASILSNAITHDSNIGGAVSDNALYTMISESEYQAAQAVNHAGTLTLDKAMRFAGRNEHNVLAYGADAAGVANSRAAIQAAITAAAADGGIVWLPEGTYLIDAPLVMADNTSAHLRGAGKNRTIIQASADMASMLTWNLNAHHSIKDIYFDGQFRVDTILDLSETYYTSVEDCFIVNLKVGGYGVKMGLWVTRIENCYIGNYGGTVQGTGILINGGAGAATNSVQILKNNVVRCDIGIQIEHAKGLSLQHNTIEVCEFTGILVAGYTEKLTIQNNYFEFCGATGYTLNGTLRKASIIGYGTSTNYPLCIDVLDNYFYQDNGLDACVVLGNLRTGRVIGNRYNTTGDTTHKANYFVLLVNGAMMTGNQLQASLVITDNDVPDALLNNSLLGTADLTAYYYPRNIQVRDGGKNSAVLYPPPVSLIPENFADWSAAITQAGYISGAPYYTITGGVGKEYNIDASVAGKWFRITPFKFRSSGAASTNGLHVVIRYYAGAAWTTVVTADQYQVGNASWGVYTGAQAFFIPATATKIDITLGESYSASGDDGQFAYLNVLSCATPYDYYRDV